MVSRDSRVLFDSDNRAIEVRQPFGVTGPGIRAFIQESDFAGTAWAMVEMGRVEGQAWKGAIPDAENVPKKNERGDMTKYMRYPRPSRCLPRHTYRLLVLVARFVPRVWEQIGV